MSVGAKCKHCDWNRRWKAASDISNDSFLIWRNMKSGSEEYEDPSSKSCYFFLVLKVQPTVVWSADTVSVMCLQDKEPPLAWIDGETYMIW